MEEDRVSGSKWRNFDSHKFYALKLLDLSLGALAQPQLISAHNPLDYYYNKVAHCSQKMLHKKVISEPYFAIHIINFYSLPRENAFSSTPKNSLMYLLPKQVLKKIIVYTSNDYQYESKHSKRSESSLIYQQHAVLVMNWVYPATAGFLGNHLKSAENWVLREDELYFKKSSNMAKIWTKKKNLISISPCHFQNPKPGRFLYSIHHYHAQCMYLYRFRIFKMAW